VKFEIVELEELSGKKAKIYSVVILDGGNDETLYDIFINENMDKYEEELQDIQDSLWTYGQYTGLKGDKIIPHEGQSLGDGIVAICNRPNKILRLYGIFYGNSIAIIGGGGPKPGPGAFQNFPKLKDENELIRKIKRILDAAENADELSITQSGIKSQTNFIYNSEDYG
jgi:hypothetical protein